MEITYINTHILKIKTEFNKYLSTYEKSHNSRSDAFSVYKVVRYRLQISDLMKFPPYLGQKKEFYQGGGAQFGGI